MKKTQSSSPTHINSRIREIELLWDENELPEDIKTAYRNAFTLLEPRKLKAFLVKEIENLRNNKSQIIACLTGILTREQTIDSIKSLDESLSSCKNWVFVSEIKQECAEILTAYQMITLDLIENLYEWKQSMLDDLCTDNISIEYNGMKYINKICSDMQFLANSELVRVFNFEEGSDPFLIKASKVVEGKSNRFIIRENGDDFLVMQISQFNRAQKLERLIGKENGTIVNKSYSRDRKLKSRRINNITVSQSRVKSDFKYIDRVLNTLEKKKVYSEEKDKDEIEKPQKKKAQKLVKFTSSSSSTNVPVSSYQEIRKPVSSMKKLEPLSVKNKASRNTSYRALLTPLEPLKDTNLSKDNKLKNDLASSDYRKSVDSFINVEQNVYFDQLCNQIYENLVKDLMTYNFLFIIMNECLDDLLVSQAKVFESNEKIIFIKQIKNQEIEKILSFISEKLIEESLSYKFLENIFISALTESEQSKLLKIISDESSISAINIQNLTNQSRLQQKSQGEPHLISRDNNRKINTNRLINMKVEKKPNINIDNYIKMNLDRKKKSKTKPKEYILKFDDESENNVERLLFMDPIMLDIKNTEAAIIKYFDSLSPVFKAYLKSPEIIIQEALGFVNPEFWWLRDSETKSIAGLFILSENYNIEKKTCAIFHISCIKSKEFEIFIKKVYEKLQNENFATVEFPLVPIDFQDIIKSLPFNGAAEKKVRNSLQIKQSFQITFGPDIESNEILLGDGIAYGNWLCILQEFHKNGIYFVDIAPSSRLQEEITEVYSIFRSISDFPFSNKFPQPLEYKFPVSIYIQNNQKYQHFRKVKTKQNSDMKIYFIPTNNTQVSIFYIEFDDLYEKVSSEIFQYKIDLFAKVEMLLKETFEEKNTENLLVPCFNLEGIWNLKWILGLKCAEKGIISSAIESWSVLCNFNESVSTLVEEDCPKINKEFIFGKIYLGVLNKEVFESLEIPLLAVIVRKSNFINI